MIQLTNRFWRKVEKTGNCWNWVAFKRNGYGRFWFSGTCHSAHRLSYLAHIGEIPDGMCVLHSCDNRACVNPDHLSVGDNVENNRQRDDRLRLANKHLSLVTDIRTMYKFGWKQCQIARYFQISPVTIHQIVKRKNWKNLGVV